MPEGLKDSECEKGHLGNRPPVPYVLPTDLLQTKDSSKTLKVKLADGTVFFHEYLREGIPGGFVGTLQNGYLRKVPLPRVPQVQRASPTAVAATLVVNPSDTGYLPDPRIPLYNNLSRLLLAVGKRCLPMRLVG